MKIAISIIAALVVSFVLIMGVEALAHLLFGSIDNIAELTREQQKAEIEKLPAMALGFIILAHIVGSLGGGFITGKIDKATKTSAWVIAILLTIGGIFNLIMIWHPSWFWVDLIVYMPMVFLGRRLAK